nr:MAG TPA: hypothetical protein [Bacteriophage sp.]DAQ57331.1 MAG TPA: hypothetical protein [Bacteriophage sp.]
MKVIPTIPKNLIPKKQTSCEFIARRFLYAQNCINMQVSCGICKMKRRT